MKGLSAISLSITILMLAACDSSDTGSGDQAIPDRIFLEPSPLLFAQNYAKYVQDDASREIYNRFLHSEVRQELNSRPEMSQFMFQSALRENSAITDREVLNQEAEITEKGDETFIRFYFDQEIDFKDVYPHSPFADEGYVIRSGQINLRKDNGRWGVIGHSLDGE